MARPVSMCALLALWLQKSGDKQMGGKQDVNSFPSPPTRCDRDILTQEGDEKLSLAPDAALDRQAP